jgi:hypothetical protein
MFLGDLGQRGLGFGVTLDDMHDPTIVVIGAGGKCQPQE